MGTLRQVQSLCKMQTHELLLPSWFSPGRVKCRSGLFTDLAKAENSTDSGMFFKAMPVPFREGGEKAGTRSVAMQAKPASVFDPRQSVVYFIF